ncbi:hypothetical protein ACFZ8E_07565 [Methylobacterium sp. HMF5984]|uniref:hypothetical protein n=1 Tax=Methylobacterium sp. HMF5984 TaxID=3367370 RepID=UPI003854E36F
MADDYKDDLRHLSDKINAVEVSVGQINAKSDEASRRLQGIETDTKHTAKNLAMFNMTLARIDHRLTTMENDIKIMDLEKADRVDVDHKIDTLTKRVDTIENQKKETKAFLTRNATPIVTTVGGMVAAYIAAKLGISDLLK